MSTAGARTERALVSPTPWLLPALPLGLALVLYAPLFPPLVREWAEFPSLSHGFAVPLIAAYLIWARRDRLRDLVPEPSFWGAPLAAIGLGGLVVGVLGSESFVARVSLPVTLFGLVLLLTGPRVARETWAGIGYLVFMIPLPWATLKLVTYRSRLLDARVSAEALGWLGVPVLRDGVMLHLPNITLEVADACSSIPAIAALTSLGVAFASLSRRPLPHRITLI
ncbi:MAG TPA: exosortase, partial [Methylomirabilota bacterium]|nr:exosortase [Methylomirabilota bacterium]